MAEHIQIDDITPLINYTVGSTPATEFSIPFAFFQDADIVVKIGGVTQTLGANYSVVGEGTTPPGNGAKVTLTAAVTNTVVQVSRNVIVERNTDFQPAGGLNIPALNTELDRIIAMIQQISPSVAGALVQMQEALSIVQGQIDPNAATVLFQTRAALALATVGGVVQYAVTRGYAAIGDLGAGLYKRLPGTPGVVEAWHVQTANSVWFELVTEDDVVRPQQLGAKADGTTDDYAALEGAFRNWGAVRLMKGAGAYIKGTGFTIAAGKTMILDDGVTFGGPGVITNNGQLVVPQPHSWAATIPYPINFIVLGSDLVQYKSFNTSTGINPVTERATADGGGPAQSKWFEYAMRMSHNRNPLLIECWPGPGGAAKSYENAIAALNEGSIFLGPGFRPDMHVECYSPFQMWRRDRHLDFHRPAGASPYPHPELTWSVAGYTAGASYRTNADLTNGIGPELEVSTGANVGGGATLTWRETIALLGPSQAWYWTFRLHQVTNQTLLFGLRFDANNYIAFSRIDTGTEGAWQVLGVRAGVVTSKTWATLSGSTRLVFFLSIHGTGVDRIIKVWMGSQYGEFGAFGNIAVQRASFAYDQVPAEDVVAYPFFEFSTQAAVNKLCSHAFWHACLLR